MNDNNDSNPSKGAYKYTKKASKASQNDFEKPYASLNVNASYQNSNTTSSRIKLLDDNNNAYPMSTSTLSNYQLRSSTNNQQIIGGINPEVKKIVEEPKPKKSIFKVVQVEENGKIIF